MSEASIQDSARRVQSRVAAQRDKILRFLRDIVAIASMDGKIGEVGERCATEMRALGFDEVRFDRMGNVLGRVGNGPRTILFDSHIDTVGLGDPAAWKWDPFQGKIEDGVLYGRGACDEKGSTPGMVYALAILKELGLARDWTCWYFGNMEEWCDGIEHVPGGAWKWRLIEAAGPMEPVAGVHVQRHGISLADTETLLTGLQLPGKLPEPLRVAHLIAGGVTTGESRHRAECESGRHVRRQGQRLIKFPPGEGAERCWSLLLPWP